MQSQWRHDSVKVTPRRCLGIGVASLGSRAFAGLVLCSLFIRSTALFGSACVSFRLSCSFTYRDFSFYLAADRSEWPVSLEWLHSLKGDINSYLQNFNVAKFHCENIVSESDSVDSWDNAKSKMHDVVILVVSGRRWVNVMTSWCWFGIEMVTFMTSAVAC